MVHLIRKKGIGVLLGWFISIVVLTGLGAFIYKGTLDYRLGPVVEIISPAPYSSTTDRLITVRGITRHVTSIKLDGRPIFINTSGEFEEKLLLHDGYTIIRIDAEDRFGRHVEKTLELFKPS